MFSKMHSFNSLLHIEGPLYILTGRKSRFRFTSRIIRWIHVVGVLILKTNYNTFVTGLLFNRNNAIYVARVEHSKLK